ncbi:nucleotidyltransferase domain-containing protein [Streptomyces sp. NBC_00102]|uniref:nucleotidyltransferase domain-containing protein n=1 Tax=Streptomyces sp. NBC_00102 TaxID=2975652 RepID=UPI002259FF25|nr:amino acid transporter [Streptomyces sp. NBC_00102]MCX5399710.1 amino acid transporter [Streptomyces sp. NBC_00102]
MTTAAEVLSVLSLLRRAGAEVWIGGGWGIDALIGEQTRDHRDLDLMHRRDQEPAVLAALAGAGFTESLDQRPVRFVLTSSEDGVSPSGRSSPSRRSPSPAGRSSSPSYRELDLHPLVFAADGSAVQASPEPDRPFRYPATSFVTGTIGGTRVPCLSAEQQAYFHQGYEPTPRDLHDMALLRRAFGTATHF